MNPKIKGIIIPIACFAAGTIVMFFIIGFIQNFTAEITEMKKVLLIQDQNIKILANQTQNQINYNQNLINWAKTVEQRLTLLNQTKH